MPKYAVVSIAIGDFYQKVAEVTFPTIRRYADKINAKFIPITAQKVSDKPHWEKFQLLELLMAYERILYIDADVLIRKCCPNIFDSVPETHLGIFDQAPFVPHSGYPIQKCAEKYGVKDFRWDGKYYNTGVMVLSRCHRFLFRKPEREISIYFEQDYLNLQIQLQKPLIHEIDYKFNRMRCLDNFTGKHRFESYIIHYAGMQYERTAPFAKDRDAVEKLPDDYDPPQRVWIVVTGGLGDQMQAEPAVRYAIEHVWPKADIRVSTHFPELFAHLPIRSEAHGAPIWEDVDSEPITRESLPGPESQQWAFVSNFLCHTIDYCSIALVSRILPDIDKTFHLKVDPEAKENVLRFANRKDFSDCVLVHAGQHEDWKNRTFPQEWWQTVSDGIIEMGLTPVFVGKTLKNKGVRKLDGRERAIDLTDMLTLSEFIAIISMTPILVSNGSSPIHLAGAFDNWIILIPSMEHPDHAFPYRHGTKSYKTAALYKKLAIDDWATLGEIKCSKSDVINGPWEDYLPEEAAVLDKIKEIKYQK